LWAEDEDGDDDDKGEVKEEGTTVVAMLA